MFWLLLIFGFDTPAFAILTLSAALIHELGHIAAGILSNRKALFPKATKFGFVIKPAERLSYRDDLILTLGGPLGNIFVGILSIIVYIYIFNSEYILLFAAVNILTAVSNLLPIRGYDGYGILSAVLFMKMKNTETCEKILSSVSGISNLILLFLSLFLLLEIGEGYWLFALLFCSFLSELKKTHRKHYF